MAQPTYDETDFAAIVNHELDITVTAQAAGNYTVEVDGGPYIGSGGTINAIRDSIKAAIDLGTHPGWTATTVNTDIVRLTSVGPGQYIGGQPSNFMPRVTAPAGGGITLSDNVAFVGIVDEQLSKAIEDDGSIATALLDERNRFQWLNLDVVPRVLQINFAVDPLPGPEKTALDALVAAFTGNDPDSIFTQFVRRSAQVPAAGTLAPENLAARTAGAPDGGLKLIDATVSLEKDDPESQTTSGTFQAKLDTSSPGPDPTLLAGDYLVSWSVDWAGTSNGANVSIEVRADGSQIGLLDDEMVDGADEFENWSSFDIITVTAGTVNFALNYRKESGGGSAIVKNARLTYTQIA